jgi:lon-related putative ATP-dependent protease
MSPELTPNDLKFRLDEKKLGCKTTENLIPLKGIIGQDRAVKALKFGLNIEDNGFNIFVSGHSGTGRMTGVKNFVGELAKTKPVPFDWCYVNNFKNSYEPKAVKLPSGHGKIFKENMNNFINSIRSLLPKAFSSKDYTEKKEAVTISIEEEKNKLLSDLNKKANQGGFILKSTQIGLFILPTINGKPINEKKFMSLSQDKKNEIQKRKRKINKDLTQTMNKIRDLDRKNSEDIKKLNHEVALYTIGKSVNDIKEKYKNIPEIIEYIEDVKDDIIENLSDFIFKKSKESSTPVLFPWMKEVPFKKYEVNVIVNNSILKGAPVIIEQNPTYQNLFGRIEKEAQFGVLSTDFTMIRGGSIHKANNGFIVIPVEELFRNIFSWDSLKMSLRDKKIIIEEAGERLGFISTKGLKPEPIPLKIKVILIGLPYQYSFLYNADNDFKKLFKIKADYDLSMDKNNSNIKKYTSFMCTLCKKENLNHLKASAAARVIEYSLRLAENKNKISTRFALIADIIREANFYSKLEKQKYIDDIHIKKAIDEKYYRSNLIQEKIKDMINDGTILIDTEGSTIGQVNGLSVMDLGDITFAKPSRVTASMGLGKTGIIDIERETKLGGPIHSKGVMILSGYLTEKYATDGPLNLSARIVFEQSYGGIEGDSASSAELYAMLSALSEIPLSQKIAVTGSVNQKGEIQAIGGVNEKIEGFYEVCREKGLKDKQGVIIPKSNIKNLMLKDEVIKAVKDKKFHIYAIKNVDEGIEILTGVKAGKRLASGKFPKNTINYKVSKKIKEFTSRLSKLSNLGEKEK